MPLITCHDCKESVSDAAPYCPNCGRPIRIPSAKKFRKILRYVVIGFFSLWAIVFIARCVFISSHSEKSGQDLDKQSLSNEQTKLLVAWDKYSGQGNSSNDSMVGVSADELIQDYKANEVAADAKYKGKAIVLKGFIKSISKDFASEAYLLLETEHKGFSNVRASLAPVQPKGPSKEELLTPVSVEEKVSSATKGDIVSLLCIGKGYFAMTPTLGDCFVMQVESLKPPKRSK